MSIAINLAEQGWLPDPIVRTGVRRLVNQRLIEERTQPSETKASMIASLADSPIALSTAEANDQHYEVPTEFFQSALGPRLKYSASIFPKDDTTLEEAEQFTLKGYADKLNLESGMRVLDLGCGWGSFSLWLAEHRPDIEVVGVSNSRTQRAFIESRAQSLGLHNLNIRTADINDLALEAHSFDRAISVEMFEHVRNYQTLLSRISHWLKPNAYLLVHIFCHKTYVYPFQTKGDDNWMGKYFFTDGLMPSVDTLSHFQEHLKIDQQWLYSGNHYRRTARAWLENMDAASNEIMPCFEQTYGKDAKLWFHRWRMFFMACEEMFGYANGEEWQVAHYRFKNTNPVD